MSTISSVSSTTYGNVSGTPSAAAYQPQAAATPPQPAEVQESKVPPGLPTGMVMIDAAVLAQLMARAAQVPAAQAPAVSMNQSSTSSYTFEISKATYVGEMQNGVPHGKGTKTYPPSHVCATHTGEHIEGKMTGEGILIYRNGDKYSGQFQDGKYHGKGRLDYRNGDYQVGTWEMNTLKNGDGVIYHDDGSKYSGQFQDGKYHGKGKQDNKDGSYSEGTWEKGYFAEGTETRALGNGYFTTYVGTWKDGQRWNVRTVRGVGLQGEWKNGKEVTNNCVVS